MGEREVDSLPLREKASTINLQKGNEDDADRFRKKKGRINHQRSIVCDLAREGCSSYYQLGGGGVNTRLGKRSWTREERGDCARIVEGKTNAICHFMLPQRKDF